MFLFEDYPVESEIGNLNDGFGRATVYRDKNLGSGVVVTLPEETKIVVVESALRKNAAQALQGTEFEVWLRLKEPVTGWIQADDALIWYSDYFTDMIPDDK